MRTFHGSSQTGLAGARLVRNIEYQEFQNSPELRRVKPATTHIPLLLPKIPLYTAPSHTEAWLSQAVRWQPGRKSLWLKARIAHTLPEEPTGELNDGATRFFHASAVRGWRALWPPIAPLESEDVGLHFRCPQQHPHHRSGADRAAAAPRAAGRQRHRRQGRPHPVRRHQAAGAGRRGGSRETLGAVFRQFALARRHADQLEDDFRFYQALASSRRDAWFGRRLAIY